ncbi:MAG: replication-associated recombination protein A [Planctomycetota bacterium]
MDLFADQREANIRRAQPLAVRMRPRSLDEVVGQQHFLGKGKLLRRMIDADRLTSAVFYGPPGTGKTTLAAVIANHTKSHFAMLNAVNSGVKEVRAVLDAARERLGHGGSRTLLFLDELHRFNKAQQDILLGDVETGTILLIGATTENPFFAINSALVSRSQIFQFQPLSEDEVKALLRTAMTDDERGFGKLDLTVDDDALGLFATLSDGDARRALSGLEVAVLSQLAETEHDDLDAAMGQEEQADAVHVTLDIAEQSTQRKAIVYDRLGDAHYDAASAFIKSMRGGDPDSALYWLATMLEAGEDPRFIARRIAIFASEDIGMADPMAISVAASAFEIVTRIGMPEGKLTLAHAVVHMATAPKSRSATNAISLAAKDVAEARTVPVPRHLRDSHYSGAELLGHGRAAAKPDADASDYFGVDAAYYEPTDRGFEATIRARFESDPNRSNG